MFLIVDELSMKLNFFYVMSRIVLSFLIESYRKKGFSIDPTNKGYLIVENAQTLLTQCENAFPSV